jgi:hypothetical protein
MRFSPITTFEICINTPGFHVPYASDKSSDSKDGMTVGSKQKRTVARQTTDIIEWMQNHTIGDLKVIASKTERSGGDASSVKRLLADLESLQSIELGTTEIEMAKQDSGVLTY